MAGYYLYSLDWAALHELVDSPSTQLIQSFTRLFSKRLEPIKENLTDAYLMFGWPSKIDELADVVESHFKKSNWYDDLSSDEGDAWESTLMELVDIDPSFDRQFHGGDLISWEPISEAIEHHRNAGTDVTQLCDFGTRPFHYERPDGAQMDWPWFPLHSMHTPEETQRIATQIKSAEQSILHSRHADAADDYKRLCVAFDEIVPKGRALFVQVDT